MDMSMKGLKKMGMRKNVGAMEGKLRMGAGVCALIALPFARATWAKALLGTIATSGLATGASRYCPINEAMGVNRFDVSEPHAIGENVPMNRSSAFDSASTRAFQNASHMSLH